MTKAELIKENERFKKALKEIYSYTSLKPFENSESEKKHYAKGDYGAVYASHLGHIRASVRIALDPKWMCIDLTAEEEAEFIAQA